VIARRRHPGRSPAAGSPSSPSASTSRSTSRRRRRASSASSRSGRSTGSSTRSPSLGAGAACRAATRAPKRPPGPGSRSSRSAIWPGARQPDRGGPTSPGSRSPLARSVRIRRSGAALHPALEPRLPMPTSAPGVNHPHLVLRINRRAISAAALSQLAPAITRAQGRDADERCLSADSANPVS